MKKTKKEIKDVYDYVDAGDQSVIDYATEITNAGDKSVMEVVNKAIGSVTEGIINVYDYVDKGEQILKERMDAGDKSVIDYATEITNAGDESLFEYTQAADQSVVDYATEITNAGDKSVMDYADAGDKSVVDYADTGDKILEKEINNQAAQDKLHQQEIDANKVIVESGLTILKHYQEMFEQMKEESTENKQEIKKLTNRVEVMETQINEEGEGLFAVAVGLGEGIDALDDKVENIEGRVTKVEKEVDELKSSSVVLGN